ncbi:hypothetical protein DFR55_12022 [Herbinix hemicellulosilytica]|uniref:Nephrocystin 3-like N-terminal domain-containing protein n=1 Tax=Herbinix hemicellulosilytica TaxID=1564487 RepID=A0A0H5SV22_HERHM|nr:hypothetical protein [Herbinix hemicellulosilytica]RBP57680.1 hypothetical protein DFR55_12022 [Herbinix hemicellulosilytica]CRZ34163.1 hypothetical protein HHT355_0960 [Herbinix hemicellulosilytica]
MPDKTNIRFFLGSNTKRGFVSLFDELKNPLEGNKLYIIKGGPGSGKSSLMKKIIHILESKNHNIEYFHCASDPNSLDAFIDHDLNIAMVDGTAPHVMDPDYPGAYDNIINMAECWDTGKLTQNKSEIINLSKSISSCHRMATACISAASALLDSNIQTAKAYVNNDAIDSFTDNFIKLLDGCKKGKEKKRLLSAASVGKVVFFKDTITKLASTVYVLTDEWGAASDLIMSKINQAATYMKLERITCYCSIRTPDKIDHIIFPSIGIAVTTSNAFHESKDQGTQNVSSLMLEIPKSVQEQMTLHHKKAAELTDLACEHIKRAKILHDELESFYIGAMDFSKSDKIYETIKNEIF